LHHARAARDWSTEFNQLHSSRQSWACGRIWFASWLPRR
jgi:hypothetical protein